MSPGRFTGNRQVSADRHARDMDDLRFGTVVRTARIKRRWRQDDLAVNATVSRASVWRIEHGRLDELNLAVIRRVCEQLEIRVSLDARSRGADLDRAINARHSALHEAAARALQQDFPDWAMAHEVSFSIWGERGVIDLLLWHPGRRALLIIEFKTEIVDTGDLLATMDRRRRLGIDIARERGWDPLTVSTWVVVAASRTSERRVADHRATLRSAFPADGRRMRAWLRDPIGAIAGLSLWTGSGSTPLAPTKRVRSPKAEQAANAGP